MTDPSEGLDGDTRSRDFVQSVDRGLAIVRTFSADTPEQSVSEIASRLGMNRATTRRFLLTLVDLGYAQTDGRVYWLTPHVLELGYSRMSSRRLAEVAEPHLKRLVDLVDEASEMAILDIPEVVYIALARSRTIVTVALDVGARLPAYANSMGKVLLASLPSDEREAYLATAEMPSLLPNTITDVDAMREQLAEVAEQGYAVTNEELEPGLVAVAVPVHDRTGSVCAAINLSTHRARRSLADLQALLPELQRVVEAMERELELMGPQARQMSGARSR